MPYRFGDGSFPPFPEEESAVDNLLSIADLIRVFAMSQAAHTHLDIWLMICGEKHHVKTNLCIMDAKNILLLVQENKCYKEKNDPEPQLIAKAIVVFQTNNHIVMNSLFGLILSLTYYPIPNTLQALYNYTYLMLYQFLLRALLINDLFDKA
ncbi:hypothetical protein H4582DRAFT_1825481 [Lactarius indigo]|nr:hypothetical protein H4582DRAFT_1825481 [Lactarius indigo]